MYADIGIRSFYLLPSTVCIYIVEFGFQIGNGPTIRANEMRPVWTVYDNSNALVVPGMGTWCNKQ